MKTFRFIGMVLAAIIVSVSFAACGDDDDDTNASEPVEAGGDGGSSSINVSELLGLWEPVHVEGYEIEDDGTTTPFNMDVNAASNDEDLLRIEFLEGGTYRAYYYDNGWQQEDAEDSFTYRVSGNKIQIQNNTDSEGEWFDIVSLTSDQLIVEWRDGEIYEKITYKKIR